MDDHKPDEHEFDTVQPLESIPSFVTESAPTQQRRDASGRFIASGDPPARPVQVWLKPDVLERLDAYCALYGIGRGRAIGHLLQGALPDPRWMPAGTTLLNQASDAEPEKAGTTEATAKTRSAAPRGDVRDPELEALGAIPRSQPHFQAGDRVANSTVTRFGSVSDEPLQWVAAVRLADGAIRPGHWSYAVAWDGQSGLTIRYPEDLLQLPPKQNKAC